MSLTAVYNYPDRGYRPATQLEVGKEYHVERVNMGQSSTDIHLSGLGCFNSVHFDFFEDGEPIDIYRSPKYNPYLRGRTMATEQRLIDANALWAEISEDNPLIHLGPFGYVACSPKTDGELVHKRADVLRAIESAPTVDAVEVVRCKDCKHYKPRNQSAHWEHKEPCCSRSAWIKFPPDGFCSYGERRTNG